MIRRSFWYSMNMHCPTCWSPSKLQILTGISHFLTSLRGSSIDATGVWSLWRRNASEVILGHEEWRGFLPLYGGFELFFLVKSIERFHCIGTDEGDFTGDDTGLDKDVDSGLDGTGVGVFGACVLDGCVNGNCVSFIIMYKYKIIKFVGTREYKDWKELENILFALCAFVP